MCYNHYFSIEWCIILLTQSVNIYYKVISSRRHLGSSKKKFPPLYIIGLEMIWFRFGIYCSRSLWFRLSNVLLWHDFWSKHIKLIYDMFTFVEKDVVKQGYLLDGFIETDRIKPWRKNSFIKTFFFKVISGISVFDGTDLFSCYFANFTLKTALNKLNSGLSAYTYLQYVLSGVCIP